MVDVKETHSFTIRLAAPASEFNADFVQAMANRMAVSFHKYGLASEADIDVQACALQRLVRYSKDGNTEWLVDAANFLMMEFMRHPDAFRATDSDESPGRTRLDGRVDALPNNEGPT